MTEAFSRLSLSLDGGGEGGGGGSSVGFGPPPVSPMLVTVSPVTPTLPAKPCKLYVDVRCERGPERVRFIAFRNLYTAYVTVKARVPTDPSSSSSSQYSHYNHHNHQQHHNERWHDVLVSHRCMEDPHYEDDAQALHVVELPSETTEGVSLAERGVTALRIYLYQPSPRWASLNIGIRHVAAFASGTLRSIRLAMLAHITWLNKNGGPGGGHGGDVESAAEMGMEWGDEDWTSGGGVGLGTVTGMGGGGIGGGGGSGGGGGGGPGSGSPWGSRGGSRAGSPAMWGSPTTSTGPGAVDPGTAAGILTACADMRSALKAVSKARLAAGTGGLSASGGRGGSKAAGQADGGGVPGGVGGEAGASEALFGAVTPSAADDEILYAL